MSSTNERPPTGEREHLIESHLPLVRSLARRYAGLGVELDDLVQVGAVGLIKASDRFDPGRGVAFATFATPTIEGEIRHHLRDRSSTLRVPRQLQQMSRTIHRRQGELAARLGRSPTVPELAEALQTDEAMVERALAAEAALQPVPLTDDEGSEATATDEASASSDDRLTLASTIRALDERERQIVYLRFHADQTERQIAQQLGISQAHVSRLLGAALAKLRASIEFPTPVDTGDTTPAGAISPVSTAIPASKPASERGRRSGSPARAKATRARTEPLNEDEVRRLRAAIAAWVSADQPAAPPFSAEPEQEAAPNYSGRFLVRMPSELHERLARAAEREQISLNRFVVDALGTSVSETPPTTSTEPPAVTPSPIGPAPGTPSPRTVRRVLVAGLIVVVLAAAVAIVLLVLALQRGI